MDDRMYLCIDLKSFFASVECAERGLDTMTARLVVADPARGSGAICLAVSPALKALGVRNRCRIFEIPAEIDYITALPRMKLYMEYAARIYSVYLRYISPEDIHVYSVDECFLDITSYRKLYGLDERKLAKLLTDAVFRETGGICATTGIGTNLFLAKVALDITAKHAPDRIGFLDEAEFRRTVSYHRPLTDIWNIGHGIARRLERMGIYDLHGVAECDEAVLYREFGVNAEYLIDHAHGREPCTIADIHAYEAKSASISNGQILFEDYRFEDALTVLKEMIDPLVLEMVERHQVTDSVSLQVGYSRDVHGSAGGTCRLDGFTDSAKKIRRAFVAYFRQIVNPNYPIRRLGVGLNNLQDAEYARLDLFTDLTAEKREHDLQRTVIDLRRRFGKNAVLHGLSLGEKATARRRNRLIGGHNSGEEQPKH